MTDEKRRYCVVIELEPSSTLQRITSDMPKVLTVLGRFSDPSPHLAFRSKDGILSAFFIRTNKPLEMLRAELEKGTGDGRDTMMAFEVGEKFTGTAGFSRAWTWLQHH